MIIDVHTHLGSLPPHKENYKDNFLALLKEMNANRLNLAFVLPSLIHGVHAPSFEETVALTKGKKNIRLLWTARLDSFEEHDLRVPEDRIKEKQIIGIKVYPGYEHIYPSDERCFPIYALCQRLGVPIMFHTGDTLTTEGDARVKFAHPLHIDDVAVQFPTLNIIICHLGNPWTIDCAEVLYKNKNVYADISGLIFGGSLQSPYGLLVKKRVQELLIYSEAGAEKLLYGTDWPLASMKTYLTFVKGLGIGKKQMDRMMYKNAIELFQLSIQ